MMLVVFDVGPCRVDGGRLSATRARVLWTEGRLYVARSPNTVYAAPAEAEPVAENGDWRVALDTGETVSLTQRGCTHCGYQQLRAAKPAKLMEVGDHWLAHHPPSQVTL